jgi:alpha-1,2-rhamnosyltransferase
MRHKKQLLVDISELVKRDSKTGIQRVVRSILWHLLATRKAPFRVVPVYSVDGTTLMRADAFAAKFTKSRRKVRHDTIVSLHKGDIYLGLDLTAHLYPLCEAIIDQLQEAGVTICHVVYDLTPLQNRSWHTNEMRKAFKPWFKSIVGASQQLICISKSTQRDVQRYVAKHKMPRPKNQRIKWFHLGCDMENSKPTVGVPASSAKLLRALSKVPTFLMVSTIEPRKGHYQVLKACESLWRAGKDFNLCIVGKAGWHSERVIQQIQRHALLNKRLFWLDNASDEYLEKLYKRSDALLNASEAEGFGLPMIEAARRGIPIIARDLSVNREVCGKHAFYFRAKDSSQLAKALTRWLNLNAVGRAPSSRRLPVLSWSQSAANLLKCLASGPFAHAPKQTNNNAEYTEKTTPKLPTHGVLVDPAMFVTLIYVSLLNRSPRVDEVQWHLNCMKKDTNYLRSLPVAVLSSPERELLLRQGRGPSC